MNRPLLAVLLALTLQSPRAWDEITAAEDKRAATPQQLGTLLQYAHDADAGTRRRAIRALGRLERAELTDTIARALHDPDATVREQAAWSIAQANMPNRTPVPAREIVMNALEVERAPAARAALAEALGRLRQPDAAAARAAALQLTSLIDSDRTLRLGVTRGLFFIMRQGASIRSGLDSVKPALIDLATTAGTDSLALRIRRMATLILVTSRMADSAVANRLVHDPDPYVRREAVPAVPSVAALRDPFWRVRFEALRRYPSANSCDDVVPFIRDANIHVRLQAIDVLGAGCRPATNVAPLLDSIGGTITQRRPNDWHEAAHAIKALAARDALLARKRLPSLAAHPVFFARAYAATAAGIAADTALVMKLTNDAHPNVRTAAIQSLAHLRGHAADSVYLAQLTQTDNQLLLTAATALDSTSTPHVAEHLIDALDRISASHVENTRDAREAMLHTIGNIGSPNLAPRLRPYLEDFDPAIANHAADIITRWTGQPTKGAPHSLDPVATPAYADVVRMSKERLIMTMRNGDVVTVKLLPFDAPTNAARFERLAKSGYFNGLTLHRVEQNFVVQGGSPNANEYRGAPRFSRDELGVPNYRGTIGLSTRGHDTGDAQIFINSVDNELLDPFYTVFAVVTSGMDAVDRMLEGATIKSIVVK